MADSTKNIVADAHRRRKNRVYYESCFSSTNLRENGTLQDERKSRYDRVTLDESTDEFLKFYGFGRDGSYFDLSVSIVSLYPQKAAKESNWRLAELEFIYLDMSDNRRYSYSHKQLIDYSTKRETSSMHDSRNTYKIGALSIEIVLPFSLTRILFNGYLNRCSLDGTNNELVSTKFTISTHPNCDKFDYKYRFDPEFVCKTIEMTGDSKKSSDERKRLLAIMLDDRIDTPLMYQVYMEHFEGDSKPRSSTIMWGAKVKRFFHSGAAVERPSELAESMDDLFVWSTVGHQVHLSRPLNHRRLVNGMVQSSLDYASYLLDCKLTSGKVEQEPAREVVLDFNDLDSFANLKPGMEIYVKAFTSKEYIIRIETNGMSEGGLMKVDINGYEGWATCCTHNPLRTFVQAQSILWTVNIHDQRFGPLLASEELLGGKGNSLIDLNRLIDDSWLERNSAIISVPRGVIMSSVAYHMWLRSNPLIERAIQELDCTRRALSARSVHTNPLSDKYLPLAQAQQILREQCKKTCLLLNSCPLPQVLIKQLLASLKEIFTDEELRNAPAKAEEDDDDKDDYNDDNKYKLFAVRSSAVGEDSLETSAAGQMRTILKVRGFDSIVRSIVDCWSSQFEPEAVMYKTHNGLDFNLPMAVVVQELIPCMTAGVATTCDPLTGDKGKLQILANSGLGEGVVSGYETDTIQLSLGSLKWDPRMEQHVGHLSASDLLYKITSDSGPSETCCLNDDEILALAELMVRLRSAYDVAKDREVEWGITWDEPQTSDSSSSSSSGSSSQVARRKIHIHLLQSRPLTHLSKLESREIDHELDHGLASPINLMSRANLGEVMPGALCPLTCSFFFPIVTTIMPEKPFEEQHTYKTFAASSFTFHTQLVAMVLTYSDTISRFGQAGHDKGDTKSEDRANMFKAMIGTTDLADDDRESRVKLTRERVNPASRLRPTSIITMAALDSGLYNVFYLRARRLLQKAKLERGLTSIDRYIELLEQVTGNKGGEIGGGKTSVAKSTGAANDKQSIYEDIEKDIKRLFGRLTRDVEPLNAAWRCHIRATLVNMALNAICMKMLSQQPAYPDSLASNEVLNDFSALMQGGGKTESGSIASLLDELVPALMEDGKFEEARDMKIEDLYRLLTASHSARRGSELFKEFIKKNGHRSFKEFDFSTLTWADDPSYIVKSLSTRLRLYKADEAEKERQSSRQRAEDNRAKVKDILDNKVQSGRALLKGYLLPRCRSGTVRREGSKSLIIEAISRYRDAFRHLGGLLCLAGRLPSAELIFQLTVEELELFVHPVAGNGADLSRLLYKCRRRQQRARVLNKITYPTPMLEFDQVIELTKRFTGETAPEQTDTGAAGDGSASATVQVRGLTSCAGRVTGRACVVQSLDEMDQIQPNDILITYSIDISWSVYFFTLAGIVTEIGGIVSHGAVVAREYGIPTLCTAIGACSIFRTGQMVTLDADRATCYLASDGPEASSSHTSESNKQQPAANGAGDRRPSAKSLQGRQE